MLYRSAIFAMVVAGILAAGCAGNGRVRNEAAIYERHAGAPVSQARLSSVINWRPLSSDLILLHSGRRDYYLIEPSLPCKGHVRTGQFLAFPGHGVVGTLKTMDTLLVDGQDCQVVSIRPVDYEAVQADLGDQESEGGM